jgi:hypothetical protein
LCALIPLFGEASLPLKFVNFSAIEVFLFWDRSLEVSSGFTPRTTPARAFDVFCPICALPQEGVGLRLVP